MVSIGGSSTLGLYYRLNGLHFVLRYPFRTFGVIHSTCMVGLVLNVVSVPWNNLHSDRSILPWPDNKVGTFNFILWAS